MECIYNSNYLIYKSGLVWSKKSNKYLKAFNNSDGYHLVDIGNKKSQKVHRLVAIHYIPNPYNLPQVDHMNRIKTDNDVSNLRWASRADNMNNKGKLKTNKSGHSNIYYHKRDDRWRYEKTYYGGKRITRYFKSKTDALCYKYIMCLRIKAGHLKRSCAGDHF